MTLHAGDVADLAREAVDRKDLTLEVRIDPLGQDDPYRLGAEAWRVTARRADELHHRVDDLARGAGKAHRRSRVLTIGSSSCSPPERSKRVPPEANVLGVRAISCAATPHAGRCRDSSRDRRRRAIGLRESCPRG